MDSGHWIVDTWLFTISFFLSFKFFEQRYIGKTHILTAIERFHAAHADVALELNVTR